METDEALCYPRRGEKVDEGWGTLLGLGELCQAGNLGEVRPPCAACEDESHQAKEGEPKLPSTLLRDDENDGANDDSYSTARGRGEDFAPRRLE